MSFSIQTNVNSMIAQENMRVNNNFQTRTITRLTSGYRINSSADDAAGLAVANQYRDSTAELTQGVRNANDGISQLQIVDGGLSNISNMLDRLQTLATESASQTFTGSRATLQGEYSDLLAEIDRQANNIGLGAGNSNNISNVGVYIGGGQNASSNSTVNVDLRNSGVGTTALGLNSTSIVTGGAVTIGLHTAAQVAAGDTATFVIGTATGTQTIAITGNSGDTLQSQLNELNAQLQPLGITAGIDATAASGGGIGALQFTSANAFSVSAYATTAVVGANNLVDNGSYAVGALTAGNTTSNTSLYTHNGYTEAAGAYQIQVTVGSKIATATLAGSGAATYGADVSAINAALKAVGVTAVSAVLQSDAPGTISLQGSETFSVKDNSGGGYATVGATTPPSVTPSGNPSTAIDAIKLAIQKLGTTQGVVGAGQNALNYAINLAQSQIANFSAAQSQIRDADVAAEAANLTKAQVLQQSSIAAMAQANSAPQAILKLLQ